MPQKFLLLGGGVGFAWKGGGGSANFIFMGAGIFAIHDLNQNAPNRMWEGTDFGGIEGLHDETTRLAEARACNT